MLSNVGPFTLLSYKRLTSINSEMVHKTTLTKDCASEEPQGRQGSHSSKYVKLSEFCKLYLDLVT